MYIGYMYYDGSRSVVLGIAGDDKNKKVTAGTISSNQLVITVDGTEYTITLPEGKTITINNPY